MSTVLGILVFMSPCGIVYDVKELYGSESKTQVYGYLHDLMTNNGFQNIGKYNIVILISTPVVVLIQGIKRGNGEG